MSVRVRWSIEVKDLLYICNLIHNDFNSKTELANELGRGKEKIRASLEWLTYMELIKKKKPGSYTITNFYKYIKFLLENNKQDDVLALIYHRLYKNYEMFKWFIGVYGNQKLKEYDWIKLDNEKTIIAQYAKSFLIENNYNVKDEIIVRQLRNDLNSLYKNEGFGKLNLINYNENEKEFKFSSYVPSDNVVYNILLFEWPENAIRMSLDFFLNNIDSVGAMFLLNYDQVMQCLKSLERLNLIEVINKGKLFYVARKNNDTIESYQSNNKVI